MLGMGLPASGVTLDELAARMDRMEKKLAAYEARYGPLEEGPLPETMQGPGRPSSDRSAKGTLPVSDDAASIDAAYGAGAVDYRGGSSWYDRTTFGGYGEMHLQMGDRKEIDFHRWVLFLDHKFNDRITLKSELELEHSISGDGKDGEIELEQAYLDIDLGRRMHAKAGLFLLPVGLINETHEPNTFYGTERNPVEKEIIPTTWWEGGLGLTQTLDNGIQWDLALHSGLDVPSTGSNAYRIRSGRQKVSKAEASDGAVTGRLRYTGMPGLDVSVFGQYQGDITQSAGSEDNSAVLGGLAASFQRGGFGLRGLAGYWNIDGPTPKALGRDEQYGYYLEPSYSWMVGCEARVGLFCRYNYYEYAKGDIDQIDVGVNFWPIDNVVFKADYSYIDERGLPSEDVFNLGVGYSF
jgi:hypothetical protein